MFTLKVIDAMQWFDTPSHAANAVTHTTGSLTDKAAEVLGLDMLEMRIRDEYSIASDTELVLYELRTSINPLTGDSWGNTMFASVQYDAVSGACASWGGHRELGTEAGMSVWVWQCYAD